MEPNEGQKESVSREEFSTFLENAGVTDFLMKLLTNLYSEFDHNDCALDPEFGVRFIKSNLGLPTSLEVEYLKSDINRICREKGIPERYPVAPPA